MAEDEDADCEVDKDDPSGKPVAVGSVDAAPS